MTVETMTVGSLFTGIGGLDLGLERAGHKVLWQSEIDGYANKVLAKHWPNVPNLGDVTKIDWGKTPYVDIIAGGYPCQPFSTAGKRRGTNDPRHLWPHFRNAISAIRPRYALLENVPGHVSLGLPTVLSDLSALGYCAEWQIISAAAFNAPHLRERLFIVAYADGERLERARPELEAAGTKRSSEEMAYPASQYRNERKFGHGSQKSDTQGFSRVKARGKRSNVAHTQSGTSRNPQPYGVGEVFRQTTEFGKQNCDGRTSSDWWEIEPNVGRVANGVSNRVDRLRGLGNAVVPQVAEFVGLLIAEHAKTI